MIGQTKASVADWQSSMRFRGFAVTKLSWGWIWAAAFFLIAVVEMSAVAHRGR